MANVPYKCPKCPTKHYYGTLVTGNAKSAPKCPNCSTALVPVRGTVAER